MRSLSQVARIFVTRIHRPQVALEFPIDVLERGWRNQTPLPKEYEVRQPPHPGDEDKIIELLQQEPGFGTWNHARLQRDLFNRLAHPMSALLVLHHGVPAACGFATDGSTRRKVAHGMYLYVAPHYRGRTKLAHFVTFQVLWYCVEAGYEQVIAYTDPTRLSALLHYLLIGVRPVYDTVTSVWQWRRILRRLGPALQRKTRVRPSKATPPIGEPRSAK